VVLCHEQRKSFGRELVDLVEMIGGVCVAVVARAAATWERTDTAFRSKKRLVGKQRKGGQRVKGLACDGPWGRDRAALSPVCAAGVARNVDPFSA
jgi:hypothetical protein